MTGTPPGPEQWRTRTKLPWYHPFGLLQRALLIAFGVYIALCVYLALMQTKLLYYGYNYPIAPETAVATAKTRGLIPWPQTSAGARGPQGFVAPNFADPAPRGTIVFFHGNGEAAWEWVTQMDAFRKRGFRVFFYEYPGYGGRPGVPSEKTIVPDARAVVKALADAGLGPIYVWGQSLGAGVAVAVCADSGVPVEGLTLVTPWDSLPNVAAFYYPIFPVRLLLIDRYDSIANLMRFGHPVCVVYGDRDDTIPPALALNLFAHLPDPKKLILKAGYGHGDWPDDAGQAWWDDALDFIAPRKSP